MNRMLYACLAATITFNTHAMNQLALRAIPLFTTKSTQLLHKQWYTPVTSCITKRKNSSLAEPNSNSFMDQWNTLRNTESTEKYNQLHQLVLHSKDITQQNLQQCALTIAGDKRHYTDLLRVKKMQRDRKIGMTCSVLGVTGVALAPGFYFKSDVGAFIGTISPFILMFGGLAFAENDRYKDVKQYRYIEIDHIPIGHIKNNLNTIDAIEKLIIQKNTNHKSK